MRYRRILTLLALISASVAGVVVASEDVESSVEASYIVILNDDAGSSVDEVVGGAMVTHRYGHAVEGFSAVMDESEAKALASHPDVAIVERDSVVSVASDEPDDSSLPVETWGLDRIDQRKLPLDGEFDAAGDGTGVHAYVVDSGIRESHDEFDGRIGEGFSAIDDGVEDCFGHGSQVAGTLGGSTYGVAPDVTLHPVRVTDCEGFGTVSGYLAALDWVAANAIEPAVVNVSLAGPPDPYNPDSGDVAIANIVESGVTVVVAAGNDSSDACEPSPARSSFAITVGASTQDDERAGLSNVGPCVDIFAPGEQVLTAGIGSDDSTEVLTGTSLAAPHVAGAAAIVLEGDPSLSPSEVTERLLDDATPDVLSDVGSGSPNLLLYVGVDCAGRRVAECPNGSGGAVDDSARVCVTDGTNGSAALISKLFYEVHGCRALGVEGAQFSYFGRCSNNSGRDFISELCGENARVITGYDWGERGADSDCLKVDQDDVFPVGDCLVGADADEN